MTAAVTVESLLRDTEARLQQIVDNTANAIFIKDLEGRFLFVNREFERIKEVRVADIVGRLDREVFPEDAAADRRQNDRRVVAERRALDFEETVETAHGTRTYLSHKFPLLDSRGEPYAVCGIATDITRRKEVEDALRAAALAVSSAEGSKVFRELARYLAEILGAEATLIAVFGENDPSRMRTLAAHLNGRALANFEYALEGSPCAAVVGRAFRFVGSGVHPEFPRGTLFAEKGMDSYAALPLNDSAGQPLGLIAAMDRQPMTDPGLAEAMLKIFAVRAVSEIERSRTESRLRASEASYRSIFEASEDAIFVHDWDTGRIVDVNPRACATYGLSPEEFREVSIDAISAGVPPYTTREALSWIERAKAGEPVRFEWHRRNRDGSLHWDEVDLKAAQIAGIPRILAFAREITERKHAEEALRAREEQYRAIFDGSTDGLVLWNRDIRIVDVNAAYAQMYGDARKDVIGTTFNPRIPKDSVARRTAMIQRALAGQEGQLEETAYRVNGETFLAELRYLPILYRGEPHVLAIVRDITERKRAEEQRTQLEAQLRQAQKMEAIGQLTGGIAHDFNNILTSVLGYTVLALERAEAAGDATQVRYLQQTRRASQRARDLIQQMLTFSRGRRGAPRPLSWAPLVRESLALLRSTLPATIELDGDLAHAIAPVRADPVQLEQVLLNLCINARDAISGAGSIRVTLAERSCAGDICASCRCAVHGRHIELCVSDTGTGIAPAVLDRMFEPFYSTKDVGKGSGMGLSTVHGIVHEHQGHVIVESEPGRGASFRVLLPALAMEGAEPLGEAGAVPRATPRKRLAGHVLVVDDEAMVAEYLSDMLEGFGLAVTVKGHPDDAMSWFETNAGSVDVVITDQTMPRRTGLELARELTRQRPGLPVLLHTGYGEDLDPDDLARAGIVDMLRKPVDPAAFLALLARHLPHA
jgi:PAS domain S-box-containing protein